MDSADKAKLSALRDRIDVVDDQILALLRERMDIVRDVALTKQKAGKAIRDARREQQLVDDRRQRASKLGLMPDPVEAIYHQVMLASRDYQASLGAQAVAAESPRKIAIIGGLGAMGRLLTGMFEAQGHTVQVVDRHTELTAESAAREADVVVISVPIAVTEDVVRQVGPHVRPDALLMDITSVKARPLAAMLEATAKSGAAVVGAHPMFGPGVSTLVGRRVILCEGRGEQAFEWVKRTFEARGLLTTHASADEHDRAMALVQVLNHFQTQVFGLALARLGVPLSDTLRYTSPSYLMELYTMARHFAQDPELYAAIEMRNPEAERITGAFCAAAKEVSELVAEGDVDGFCRVFEEVRGFLGDFANEASEQSRYLLDMLAERASS